MEKLSQCPLLCENELYWLDMSVNFKKSCCLRVGQRFNVTCAKIISLNGQNYHGLAK